MNMDRKVKRSQISIVSVFSFILNRRTTFSSTQIEKIYVRKKRYVKATD